MTVFDQRSQIVGYQYNAAGDINFGSVQNSESLLRELRKLRTEFDKAAAVGLFEEEVVQEVRQKLDEVLLEAEEVRPNKKKLEEYLKEAKSLIEGIALAAGLVTALAQAAELVRRLL